MSTGPVEVAAGCEAAVVALLDAFAGSAVTGSRDQWAAAIGAAQRVIDVASAAQDAAIAQLAAIEPQYLQDGTEVESHRGLGHAALDAPAIVSGVLATSAVHAERRVRAAVRLAGDGPPGSPSESGLAGLHTAMAAGRLDAYRAGVIAEELEHAPAPVAASVVAALEGHFGVEDGTLLRRRCRRVLTRISPDLLRQRATRAREECGLRRCVDEPGVDRWEGTFPSQAAATAWAAIDALAHQYVKDGAATSIEAARGTALTDLVAGNATITTVLTVTVPATALPTTTPAATARAATTLATALPATSEGAQAGRSQAGRSQAGRSQAGRSQAGEPAGSAGGGHEQAPGAAAGRHPTADAELDLVEVTGLSGAQPVLISRQWLTATAASPTTTVQVTPCHPVTGALVDPNAGTHRDTDTYRPTKAMTKRIKARDRRCRFPGCSVAAVFCDLDHVRPFPTGPTRDENLICLCRRHHRIKQRPGWHATLTPDATVTWIDPTGRTRTTDPVDALTPTVLRDTRARLEEALTATGCASGAAITTGFGSGSATATGYGSGSATATGVITDTGTATGSRALTVLPEGPHSYLEHRLEHLTAAVPLGTAATWRDDHGTHRIDLQPTAGVLVRGRPAHRRPPRQLRPPTRHRDDDPPPF